MFAVVRGDHRHGERAEDEDECEERQAESREAVANELAVAFTLE
jgi:hypothetical protein